MSPFRTKGKFAYHLLKKKEILQAQSSSAVGQVSPCSPLCESEGRGGGEGGAAGRGRGKRN